MSRIIASGVFVHGSKGSIGATALALTAVSSRLNRGVSVKADAGNSGFVFVGGSAVTAGISAPTTDGYKLAGGEECFIEIDDPSRIFVIGSTTGQAVSWIGA